MLAVWLVRVDPSVHGAVGSTAEQRSEISFDASPAGESGRLPRPNGGMVSTCRTRSSCRHLLRKGAWFRLDGTRRKIARLASRFIRILRRSSARESRHPVLVFAMARCSGLRFSVRFSYSRPRPISRRRGDHPGHAPPNLTNTAKARIPEARLFEALPGMQFCISIGLRAASSSGLRAMTGSDQPE
jgi:hypothetical protein